MTTIRKPIIAAAATIAATLAVLALLTVALSGCLTTADPTLDPSPSSSSPSSSSPSPSPLENPTVGQTPETEHNPPEGIKVGEIPPDFVLDLRGESQIALRDGMGGIIVLNAFATWCPPCKAELPDLQRISDVYKGDVDVVIVSVGEDKQTVDDFFDGSDYTMHIAYDVDGDFGTLYKIQFIPQTWIINRSGVIVDYLPSQTTFEALSASLDKLLP